MLFFELMMFTILPRSLYVPSTKRIRKQIICVIDSGKKFFTIVPKNKETAKIELHTTFIIVTEINGILTLFVPYAKLAIKASVDKAVTIIMDSKIDIN